MIMAKKKKIIRFYRLQKWITPKKCVCLPLRASVLDCIICESKCFPALVLSVFTTQEIFMIFHGNLWSCKEGLK